jgi:hypothetical protein
MPPIPIKVVRIERRKPYSVRMTRALARKLGAFVPGAMLWGQIDRGATNLPLLVVIPVKRPGSEIPDGGTVLVWNIREDDEGDIKRKDKEAA